MKKINVAIVGATGIVGQTFLKILKEKHVDEMDIRLFASSKSDKLKIKFKNKYLLVHTLDESSFDDVDYALFFTESSISKQFIPIALKNNAVVIDNSSFYRMNDDVKLIAFGANENQIDKNDKIISNPNCCVIQCVIILNLLKEYGIKQIVYNTYQSVSGSGKKGIDDLLRCRKGLMPLFYETDISFTCIPKIGDFLEDKFSDEEIKMNQETKKILNNNDIEILSTCVRVPVMFSHGVSICVELEKQFTIDEIIEKLNKNPNIVVCDKIVPSSVLSCDTDKIYVGRIRKQNNHLLLYCVADNLRIGAATNAYNILNYLINLKGE